MGPFIQALGGGKFRHWAVGFFFGIKRAVIVPNANTCFAYATLWWVPVDMGQGDISHNFYMHVYMIHDVCMSTHTPLT